ncbi:MAG: hypothetical protein E6Q44_04755 [Flavobacteriales bacterium]|nr:MAG: hypothetical protein E6Q44_04755 [Flavobacteriales bacterium]
MGMDVGLNALERNLLESYRQHFSEAPSWAFPVAPPIPFVGRSYPENGGGVLLYASAENLGYTWDDANPTRVGWELHSSERVNKWPWLGNCWSQMLRGRIMLESVGGTSVHIGPINDGTQLKVARHIVQCLRPLSGFAEASARDFLEQIAVSNPGKYSIFSRTNMDYARDVGKFKEMVPYILADLNALRPEVLIIPGTIYNTLQRTTLKDRLAEVPKVVLISQVQPRPIRVWRRPLAEKERWCVNTVRYRWDVAAHADQYVQWIEERSMTTKWGERIIRL